jgi:hypothetical protein
MDEYMRYKGFKNEIVRTTFYFLSSKNDNMKKSILEAELKEV